ncbi:hypothetical protein BBH99_07950 [Chryseobacterium contaminans]|uniref:Uncharacterized protein n=1 Tax=Chryseobacterium contaminans TaxID=1423959 RepID=A0A1M7DQT8_9FLAO|nr:hypothetical protein [Chryseobacterium contaminans]OCA78609.1 hypothetical protein BBH99_07950 [Chryseobacterium contaminans]SHL81767.1 hypothetical protein SAMN05444407_106231 [Chryseobacterium contaminans]
MKKKIALLIPHHFNLYETIVKNLELNNYNVELLILTDKDFKYKNIGEKLSNFIQKTFLKNKNFKSQLRVRRHSEQLLEELNHIKEPFDYTLVIRPDYFSKESLTLLKQKTKVFTAYQWDGFQRYPGIVDYIKLFDRFFVFDKDDYFQYRDQYSNLFPITNFYLDHYKKSHENSKDEVFFLGSYLENRIDEIISIASYFEEQKVGSNIQIVYTRSSIPEKLANSPVKIRTHILKYAEMIYEIQKYNYLLEFHNTSIHNGLSFRVFEALCFKKKLITNNPEVKNYDFYHPNNILVWEGQNYEDIIPFLEKEYVEVAPDIYKKYAFSNWIRYVFNDQPYQPINFKEN